MSVADQAIAASLQMEAKKDGLSQLQDGSWVLKLKVHPSEMPAALMMASMGTRFMAVLVEISDDETPVSPDEQKARDKPAKDRRSWSSLPLSQQAAIRCDELVFQRFVGERLDLNSQQTVVGPDRAAAYVREHCGVTSRKSLDTLKPAGDLWRELDADFQFWLKHPEAA